MSLILYIAGFVLAVYAGYAGLHWYFIFITSLIMAVGWFIANRGRAAQTAYNRDGIMAIPKLIFIQIVMYAIITAPAYFVGSFFA